jgi:hypothetical protein
VSQQQQESELAVDVSTSVTGREEQQKPRSTTYCKSSRWFALPPVQKGQWQCLVGMACTPPGQPSLGYPSVQRLAQKAPSHLVAIMLTFISTEHAFFMHLPSFTVKPRAQPNPSRTTYCRSSRWFALQSLQKGRWQCLVGMACTPSDQRGPVSTC